jgi:hypothetical protein
LDASSDFANFARGLEDLYFVAGEEEGNCGADTTQASADDDDLGRVLAAGVMFGVLQSGDLYLQFCIIIAVLLLFDWDRRHRGGGLTGRLFGAGSPEIQLVCVTMNIYVQLLQTYSVKYRQPQRVRIYRSYT